MDYLKLIEAGTILFGVGTIGLSAWIGWRFSKVDLLVSKTLSLKSMHLAIRVKQIDALPRSRKS